MEWRPIEEIIPKEILPGHGGASFGPVLLTNGKDVWAGEVFLMNRVSGNYLSWSVHGVSGCEWEPEFENATHYMPLPDPVGKKPGEA